jgi:hypothetical protein
MRRWQANANSKPPPSAVPLSAATQGLPQVSMRRQSSDHLRLSSKNRAMAASSPCAAANSAKARLKPSSIVRSAPAQNASFPEVMTTPFTAASAVICSMIAASSSMTVASMTFMLRPGASQVTSAMPSPSVSIVKFLKLIATTQT